MPVNRIRHLQQASESPWRGMAGIVTGYALTRTERFQRSLACALQGLRDAWKTQPNLRFQVAFGAGVFIVGWICGLILIEWLWVSFAVGLVIFAELMNTAIEQTVDLAVGRSPDPLARQVKDVSAGCVLVAAIIAVVIGAFTFGPYFVLR